MHFPHWIPPFKTRNRRGCRLKHIVSKIRVIVMKKIKEHFLPSFLKIKNSRMVKPYKGQFNWVVDLQVLHGEFIFYGTNYQHWLVTIRSLIDNFQSFTLPSCSVS